MKACRGDIEVHDHVDLPRGQDTCLSPRPLILDVTMTHDRSEHIGSLVRLFNDDFLRLLFLQVDREAGALAGELRNLISFVFFALLVWITSYV